MEILRARLPAVDIVTCYTHGLGEDDAEDISAAAIGVVSIVDIIPILMRIMDKSPIKSFMYLPGRENVMYLWKTYTTDAALTDSHQYIKTATAFVMHTHGENDQLRNILAAPFVANINQNSAFVFCMMARSQECYISIPLLEEFIKTTANARYFLLDMSNLTQRQKIAMATISLLDGYGGTAETRNYIRDINFYIPAQNKATTAYTQMHTDTINFLMTQAALLHTNMQTLQTDLGRVAQAHQTQKYHDFVENAKALYAAGAANSQNDRREYFSNNIKKVIIEHDDKKNLCTVDQSRLKLIVSTVDMNLQSLESITGKTVENARQLITDDADYHNYENTISIALSHRILRNKNVTKITRYLSPAALNVHDEAEAEAIRIIERIFEKYGYSSKKPRISIF